MTKKHKNETNHEGIKALILGFVTNVLEKVSDNVTHKVQAWTKQMKRRALGGVLVVLGLTYFLTGLSDWANSMIGRDYPGLGYVAVGFVIVIIGYFIGRK